MDLDFQTIRDVFAVIGVIATTGGLGWKVYTWRRERQTRIRVKVTNALPTYGPENRPGEWCFQVEAINSSDHPVRVTSVGFDLGDGNTVVQTQHPFPSALPHEIQPHDSGFTLFELDGLEARTMDTYGEIVGFVDTSGGHRFRSEPRVLRRATSSCTLSNAPN
jgi:hypothetical protein